MGRRGADRGSVVAVALKEVQKRGVEVVGVLPDAAVAAGDRSLLGPGDEFVQVAGQGGGDEDVLLSGEHERR